MESNLVWGRGGSQGLLDDDTQLEVRREAEIHTGWSSTYRTRCLAEGGQTVAVTDEECVELHSCVRQWMKGG